MRKRLGLAGAGPRDDQQGAARAVSRRAGLIRVEVCKTVRWRHGSELRSIPKLKVITIRSGSLSPQPAGLIVREKPNTRDHQRCSVTSAATSMANAVVAVYASIVSLDGLGPRNADFQSYLFLALSETCFPNGAFSYIYYSET